MTAGGPERFTARMPALAGIRFTPQMGLALIGQVVPVNGRGEGGDIVIDFGPWVVVDVEPVDDGAAMLITYERAPDQ